MRQAIRFVGPGILATLLTATPAAGQQPSSADTLLPYLRYFAGRWDVVVTFGLPNGSEGQGRADCEGRIVVGDAFLEQEYTSTFRGEPLVIRQMLGNDAEKARFVQFQLHRGGGAPTKTRHLEGGFSDDGSALTLEGVAFDGFTGEPVGIRTVTRILDEDHFTVEEWFMAPGRPARRVVLLEHERRPGPGSGN